MLISTEWLSEYVHWESTPDELRQLLNNRVSEVEKVEHFGSADAYEHIVAGEVMELATTAAGARATVSVGSETLEINAPDGILVGRKYAVARPGASPATSSGVTAVFCRERDLGLSDSELPVCFAPDVAAGAPAYAALGLQDEVYHFDLEPHRPDLFSVLGFAREVAALHATRAAAPPVASLTWREASADAEFPLRVEAPELVNRYASLKLTNISIGPSPQWLQNRLRKAGLCARNNVVDITNYVMLEYGQPLHAFDYAQMDKGGLTLRRARRGEQMLTLDGKLRTLDEEVLLVASPSRILALAGIIGGEDSGISETTTAILLESANFNMTNVRRTSRIHAIRTDASLRFEKGPDPQQAKIALERAVFLLQRYAGAEIAGPAQDYFPRPPAPLTISLALPQVNEYLGSQIAVAQAETILQGLGFETRTEGAETLLVTAPAFRTDVKIFEDLVEEVGRIYGYDNIPYTLPAVALQPVTGNALSLWQERCADQLINCGFTEIRTDPWMGDEDLSLLGLNPQKTLELRNYLSLPQKYLRTSPFPALLKVVGENLKKHARFKLFELSKIYEAHAAPPAANAAPAAETYFLAGALTLGRKTLTQEVSEFYETKAALRYLLAGCNVKGLRFQRHEGENSLAAVALHCGAHLFEAGTLIEIIVNEQSVGFLGYLSKALGAAFGVKAQVCLFYLAFDRLLPHFSLHRRYAEPSKMPSAHADISLLVGEKTLVGQLQQALRNELGNMLAGIRLVDVYQKIDLENRKSVTFALEFNDPQRNLRQEQVRALLDSAVTRLAETFGAELRAK